MSISINKAVSKPLSVSAIIPGEDIYSDEHLSEIKAKQSSEQRLTIIKKMQQRDRIWESDWISISRKAVAASDYPLVWDLKEYGLDTDSAISALKNRSLNFYERNAVTTANKKIASKNLCSSMSSMQMEVVNGFVILDEQAILFSDDGIFINDFAEDVTKSKEYLGWTMNGNIAVYKSEDESLLIAVYDDGSWKVQRIGKLTYENETHEGIILQITGTYNDECQIEE